MLLMYAVHVHDPIQPLYYIRCQFGVRSIWYYHSLQARFLNFWRVSEASEAPKYHLSVVAYFKLYMACDETVLVKRGGPGRSVACQQLRLKPEFGNWSCYIWVYASGPSEGKYNKVGKANNLFQLLNP